MSLKHITARCFNCAYWRGEKCCNKEVPIGLSNHSVESWIDEGGYQELLKENVNFAQIVNDVFDMLKEQGMLKKNADVDKIIGTDEYEDFIAETSRKIDEDTCVGIKNNSDTDIDLTIGQDAAREFFCNKWR